MRKEEQEMKSDIELFHQQTSTDLAKLDQKIQSQKSALSSVDQNYQTQILKMVQNLETLKRLNEDKILKLEKD